MSRRGNLSSPGPPPAIAELLPRGLAVAPWVGAQGEVVLVATTSRHQKLAEVAVPWGVNRLEVEAQLWARLDAEDPPEPDPLRLA